MRSHRHALRSGLLSAIALFALSTQPAVPWTLANSTVPPGWLVEVDWLKQRLNAADLILVDTRNESEYSKGHLPNAISLNLDDINVRTNSGGLEMLAEELGKRFATLGITGNERVVFYDEATGTRAPKALWFLFYAGYSRVSVLHGGITTWKRAGLPQSWERHHRQARPFSVRENTSVFAKTDYVATRLHNFGSIILDVRSLVEYKGVEKAEDGARGGRIPGSVWLEWTQLLDSDGRFHDIAKLQQMLFTSGITPDHDIIIYSHRGNRSSNVTLALKVLGYPKVRNYLGSWHEWAARLDLPLEKDEAPNS